VDSPPHHSIRRLKVEPAAVRILYVTDSPTVSGAEHVLFQYLDAFRPPEHETHVLLRRSNTRLSAELDARKIAYTATNGFSTEVIRTTARPDVLLNFAAAFRRISREMATLRRKWRYDVVHSISYPSSLYVALAHQDAAVRHVWHEHNIKRTHRFNRPIYRFVARTCARVVGPSNAVVTALASAGIPADKLLTVYNGIDLERFIPQQAIRRATRSGLGLMEDEPAVGLMGQMLPYKGHATLVAAAPRVLAQVPKARFFFVGALENPPYEAQIKTLARQHGVESRVVFTGWRSDIQAVLQAMDVVVVPTLTPEPAALSLMESMALERPLVASRTGGTPEIVKDGETGILFEPGNVTQLAAAIERLLHDPNLRERLGSAARARVSREFGKARHLARMEQLYRTGA
jgi:glycosyltransferase involved in cell wall biosynthesis